MCQHRHHRVRTVQIICWGALCVLLASSNTEGQPVSRQTRHTALEPNIGISKQRISLTWEELQLRTALDRLEEVTHTSIWLDRRVDPQQRIQLELRDVSVQQVLEEIARHLDLGFSEVDSLVYLGPKQPARDLATLVQRARDSLAEVSRENAHGVRRQWLRAEATSISQLAQPRELLGQMLAASGIALVGGESVPHDVWREKELPPLAMVDRVVLLLIGFSKTCEFSTDGKICRVVPISRPVHVERQYRWQPSQRKLLLQIRSELPEAQVKVVGRKLVVRGRWEDQQSVRELLGQTHPKRFSKSRSKLPGKEQQVFSLRLQSQPVGEVIHQLANQLQLKVTWSDPLPAGKTNSRQTRVSCEVQNATLDELLQSVLSPAGLQFQRHGQEIEIEPAESP